MRAVIQRVTDARVTVDGQVAGEIESGLVVLVVVLRGDTESDADWLAEKLVGLRVFTDAEGKMNLDVRQIGGGILAISQFTLAADCRKGRRPSYDQAAPPQKAQPLYDYFVKMLREYNVPVATGVFQAHMAVQLVNDGPVTLILETPVGQRPVA